MSNADGNEVSVIAVRRAGDTRLTKRTALRPTSCCFSQIDRHVSIVVGCLHISTDSSSHVTQPETVSNAPDYVVGVALPSTLMEAYLLAAIL